ncbi:MAG TPA: hypothetical protein VFS21_40115 [Roseiflexaceae bacterium]|nr:hypothetical protein [Roseiflexaceae bacterium]
MAQRRLSQAEREQRDRERAAREQQLREQLAQQRPAITAALQRCAQAAAWEPAPVAPEHLMGGVEGGEAARLALLLAAQLLGDSSSPAGEARINTLQEELVAALTRWRRAGEGWWEVRWVERPQIRIAVDRDTKAIHVSAQMVSFGPYFYRYWRQDGEQRSRYFGREQPEGFPEIEIPQPRALEQLGPLATEAIQLAQRLAELLEATGSKRRHRVRRVLRRAIRRAERRIRGEKTEKVEHSI